MMNPPGYHPAASAATGLPVNPVEIKTELMRHWEICQEILGWVEQEGSTLRNGATAAPEKCAEAKKSLLPRLNQSLDRIRHYRMTWQRLSPTERAGYPEVTSWLRKLQDLIMKIIVLDRENEQILLRRGLVPARHLPPARAQQPHFVAELYRRQGVR